MTAQRTAPAGKGEGRGDQVGAGSGTSLPQEAAPRRGRHRQPVRPDLFERYPDPRSNFRPTMFGLTLDDYRAEFHRRKVEGWAAWELHARFPRPEVVA